MDCAFAVGGSKQCWPYDFGRQVNLSCVLRKSIGITVLELLSSLLSYACNQVHSTLRHKDVIV